jgi:glutathione S-transferase
MKYYDSLGPNPRLVRLFALERGIDLPETVQVDIMGGENRQADHLARNPSGELPALELDDGSILAETVAICEYLDEKSSGTSLVGATPEERAATRMWIRRVEIWVTAPMTDAFRSAEGAAMFKDRRHLIPQAADDWKAIGQEGIARLDAQIEGREFVAGDSLTLADIVLYALLDFGIGVGQPIDPKCTNVQAWFERMAARPSAEASLHPVAAAGGMRA